MRVTRWTCWSTPKELLHELGLSGEACEGSGTMRDVRVVTRVKVVDLVMCVRMVMLVTVVILVMTVMLTWTQLMSNIHQISSLFYFNCC